ncbi:hypothetical protein ACA910_002112 [Epithemia clementina (nom. ined.)]
MNGASLLLVLGCLASCPSAAFQISTAAQRQRQQHPRALSLPSLRSWSPSEWSPTSAGPPPPPPPQQSQAPPPPPGPQQQYVPETSVKEGSNVEQFMRTPMTLDPPPPTMPEPPVNESTMQVYHPSSQQPQEGEYYDEEYWTDTRVLRSFEYQWNARLGRHSFDLGGPYWVPENQVDTSITFGLAPPRLSPETPRRSAVSLQWNEHTKQKQHFDLGGPYWVPENQVSTGHSIVAPFGNGDVNANGRVPGSALVPRPSPPQSVVARSWNARKEQMTLSRGVDLGGPRWLHPEGGQR